MIPIESFVVEIGLDPSKFNEQQRKALEDYKHSQEEFKSRSQDIEDSAGKAFDALGGIKRQALELFAVFTGGKGLVDFSTQLIHSNAQLGRLDRNLGISASTISKWQGAARIFGGDAAAMAQSFTQVSDALAGWKIGIISPMVADFRAISTAGGQVIDINKGVEESLLQLSDNLRAIHDRDPATAGLYGRRLGLDPALFDVLIRGRAGVKEVLDYVQKIGVATEKDIDAFGELEKRMGQMGLKAESLGRKTFNSDLGHGDTVAGYITGAADWLNLSPGDAWDALVKRLKKEWGWTQEQLGGAAAKTNAEGYAGAGAFTSQSEKEAFIRQSAVKSGINPDFAVAVAKSEGFNRFSGDNGTSFGAFQLHVTPGGRGNAVGDEFKKLTGLDPSDPKNERETIMFALAWAKRHGWGDFHGAANTGISTWAGIERGGGAGNMTTTKVDINGPITINAGNNADGTAIANKFMETVKKTSYAAQANYGQN